MSGDDLRVTRTCVIPLAELEWRFSRSGAPGGQHADTSSTKAEVRFDVAASKALGPAQRARLLRSLGPLVRVVVSDERSQARNRQLALERLRQKLAEALSVRPRRVATKVPPRAKRARLEDKRRRAALKSTRARPPGEG